MTPCERTNFLIAWWDRLAPIVNGEMQANRDLCRDLAQFCGELGNDDPSEYAIGVAQEWERAVQRGEKPWLAEVRGSIMTSDEEVLKHAEVQLLLQRAVEAIQHLLNYAESIEAPYRQAFEEEYRSPLAIPNALRLLKDLKEAVK